MVIGNSPTIRLMRRLAAPPTGIEPVSLGRQPSSLARCFREQTCDDRPTRRSSPCRRAMRGLPARAAPGPDWGGGPSLTTRAEPGRSPLRIKNEKSRRGLPGRLHVGRWSVRSTRPWCLPIEARQAEEDPPGDPAVERAISPDRGGGVRQLAVVSAVHRHDLAKVNSSLSSVKIIFANRLGAIAERRFP